MKQSSKGTDTRSSLIKWPEHKMEGKKNSHQNTMPGICALCHNVQSVTKQKRERVLLAKNHKAKQKERGLVAKSYKARESEREREGGGSYSEVGLQKLKNTELGQMHKDKPAMFASLL